MKPLVIFFFISLNTFSFGQLRTIEDARIFSVTFKDAVISHNEDEIIKHIDTYYKKQQLGKLLKGNKDQFINELLSGFSNDSEEYITIDYKTITGMTISSIENEESNDNWDVNFQITTPENTINISLFLISKRKGKSMKTKLGFVGGFG
ncbi:MAG: hypothetical protein RI883_1925 [Bacteroidota bacterium]|jgi:hypothetical protein